MKALIQILAWLLTVWPATAAAAGERGRLRSGRFRAKPPHRRGAPGFDAPGLPRLKSFRLPAILGYIRAVNT